MSLPGVLTRPCNPSPLERISPSRYLGLLQCKLRDLWAGNHAPQLLPTNARARLGTIVHEMLALAGKGRFLSQTDIERYWAESIEHAEKEMLDSWLERPLAPLRQSIRDFNVQSLRALKKAHEISIAATPHVPSGRGDKQYGFELWVQSTDGRVCGYIDHVYKDRAGLVIRDYKSGYVFESSSDGAPTLKDAFAIQLKMYAGLYNLTYSQWPSKLEITPIQGATVVVEVHRDECLDLVAEAAELLRDTNAALLRVQTGKAKLAELASPSASVCRYCSYRPHCAAYIEASADQSEDWPLDLFGSLTKIQPLENGRLALLLETRSGTESIRGIAPENRHPALHKIKPGDRIAILNLQKAFPSGSLQEGPYTTIYVLQRD